ncbi:MAG: prepilin-type N-terminal cleavage/methylation domain-containing protein [Terrimicrobiaceae bacterium]
MNPSRDHNAFTLVELLVVIAIIAILASLIMPVTRGMTENARQSQCLNNMRQIHMAIQSYLMEHGNQLMQRYGGGPNSTDGYDEALMPYIDTEQTTSTSQAARKIFTCPSEPQTLIQVYPSQPGYGLNWFYDNTMVSMVDRPAQTILLAETLGDGRISPRRP